LIAEGAAAGWYRRRIAAQQVGSCTVSWTTYTCDNSLGCFTKLQAWRRLLTQIVVEPCRSPCRTCWLTPHLCTSCENPTYVALAGKCVLHGSSSISHVVTNGTKEPPHRRLILEVFFKASSGYPLGTLGVSSGELGMGVPTASALVRSACERAELLKLQPDPFLFATPSYKHRVHCGFRVQPEAIRLTTPVALAPLSSSEVLVVDRDFRVGASFTSYGAVFVFNVETHSLQFACPTCCANDLSSPVSVRVAPSGAFWLVADWGNSRVQRINADTGEMTTFIGDVGSPELCAFAPGARWNALHSSEQWPTSKLKARLCSVSDVAIHPSERYYLVAEQCGAYGHNGPRIRLLDESDGLLFTIVSLAPRSCVGRVSLEWVSAHGQYFIVACGQVHLFGQTSGGEWAPQAFEVDRPLFSHILRASFERHALLLVNESIGSSTLIEISFDSFLGVGAHVLATQLAGGGSIHEVFGSCEWADEVLLNAVSAVAALHDGSLIFASSPLQEDARLARLSEPCPPGMGRQIRMSSSLSSNVCALCSEGSFNDGSHIECRTCAKHETSPSGSETCTCRLGYMRPSPGHYCLECRDGNYCPGLENEIPCVTKGTTFDLSSNVTGFVLDEAGPFPSLRIPGVSQAKTRAQCGCCFGKFKRRQNEPSEDVCEACPEGFWCSGIQASPNTQLAMKNGYWHPDLPSLQEAPGIWSAFRCPHVSLCWWASYPMLWQARSREPCAKAALTAQCDPQHCAGIQTGGDSDGSGSQCTAGREGPLCGRCSAGQFSIAHNFPCRDCPDNFMYACVITIVIALLSLIFVSGPFCVDLLYAAASSMCVLLMFATSIDALQLQTNFEWPYGRLGGVPLLTKATPWAVIPFSTFCFAELSFIGRRALLAFAPLVCMTFLIFSNVLAQLILRMCCARRKHTRAPTMGVLNVAGLLLTTVIHPWSAMALNYFQCFSHPDSHLASLWWSPDIFCFEREWLGGVVMAFFGIGLIVGWIAVLCTKTLISGCAKRFMPISAHVLLACTEHQRKRFRPGWWHWDMLNCVRALILQISLVTQNAEMQLYCATVVSMLAFVALTVYRPHRWLAVNLLEAILTHMLLMLSTSSLSSSRAMLGDVTFSFGRGLLTVAVTCAVGMVMYVMAQACRDLWCPMRGARQASKRVDRFVATIRSLSMDASRSSDDSVRERFLSMDGTSLWQIFNASLSLNQVLETKRSESQVQPWRIYFASPLSSSARDDLAAAAVEPSVSNTQTSTTAKGRRSLHDRRRSV